VLVSVLKRWNDSSLSERKEELHRQETRNDVIAMVRMTDRTMQHIDVVVRNIIHMIVNIVQNFFLLVKR
jgi:hypothetical protein